MKARSHYIWHILFFVVIFTLSRNVFSEWAVFSPLRISQLSTNSNLVRNYDCEETGTTVPVAQWNTFGEGYTRNFDAQSGTQSIQCISHAQSDIHGAYQHIDLNQTSPKSIIVSGWSKAENITGEMDNNYSVYIDITYTNGSHLYAKTLPFSTGTHDWEYRERVITPSLPIEYLNCYLLLRNTHTGTGWFDTIQIAEINDTLSVFDGEDVVVHPSDGTHYNDTSPWLLSDDGGLSIGITHTGGVICSFSANGTPLLASNSMHASGWFVHDRKTTSSWMHFDGPVIDSASGLEHTGYISSLELVGNAAYSASGCFIKSTLVISNSMLNDRVLTVYFALPVDFSEGIFWDTPYEKTRISSQPEYAQMRYYTLGARGYLNDQLVSTITAEEGIAMAIPPDKYRPFRCIYNTRTHQFYIAFDIGITPRTKRFPNCAEVEVIFYRTDGTWGKRDALETYYTIYPGAFEKRYTNEGIWVAFADLSVQTNISDFHIAYHETSYSEHWKSDDTNAIQSYRYLLEPWSYWMHMPTNIPNTDYDSVIAYLYHSLTNGSSWERRQAETVITSGVRDKEGKFLFYPAAEPWCPYGAALHLSSSPFIYDTQGRMTKFSNEWNATVKDTYNHPENGILDGEYIDSFAAGSSMPNYFSNYIHVTSFPLTYLPDDYTLMSPLIFGTYECVRAIKADLDEMEKPFIANYMYSYWTLPIGIGIFDFGGMEIDCFDENGAFTPRSHSHLLHHRLCAGRKAYGFLLNTDFTKVSHREMEEYIKMCAAYAIYPSAFSFNAANSNYWNQAWLYERDRNLFVKYIPVITKMSYAGWFPVTYATSSVPDVIMERYGSLANSERMYLSFRNTAFTSVTTTVTFFTNVWGAPNIIVSNEFNEQYVTQIQPTYNYTLPFTLAPTDTVVYSFNKTVPEPHVFYVFFLIPGIYIKNRCFMHRAGS